MKAMVDHCERYRDLPQHVTNFPHIERWNTAIDFIEKGQYAEAKAYAKQWAENGWKPWVKLVEML